MFYFIWPNVLSMDISFQIAGTGKYMPYPHLNCSLQTFLFCEIGFVIAQTEHWYSNEFHMVYFWKELLKCPLCGGSWHLLPYIVHELASVAVSECQVTWAGDMHSVRGKLVSAEKSGPSH